MTFEKLIKKLKDDGFDIELQKNKYVYQINNVANLDGITISESITDYRISLWQNDVSIQTVMKTPESIYNFITNITF